MWLGDDGDMNLANVIVIDDDAFVRGSLTAGLRAFGINVVGTGQNFATALELCQTEKVDVAILDLDLGAGPTGIDIGNSLRKKFDSIGLILLTSYTNPKIADPNMPALAKGTRFISKSNLDNFQLLVNEIFSARVKPLSNSNKAFGKNLLSPVQLEVLKKVAEGLSTSEIARQRGVSQKAIEGLIAKIHKELRLEKSKSLNQRVQLTRAYFKLSGKNPPGA